MDFATDYDQFKVCMACTTPVPEYERGLLFRYRPLRAKSDWTDRIRRLLATDEPIDVWEKLDGHFVLAFSMPNWISKWDFCATTPFGFGAAQIWAASFESIPQPVLREMLGIIAGLVPSGPMPPGRALYGETELQSGTYQQKPSYVA